MFTVLYPLYFHGAKWPRVPNGPSCKVPCTCEKAHFPQTVSAKKKRDYRYIITR